MEITYVGHACFKVKGRGVTLIFDPYDPQKTGYKFPKEKADIVFISHNHEDHNYTEGVSDYSLLINGPGEYEKSGVLVMGISTSHDASLGKDRGKNTIYLVNVDGFDLLHLGDLGHELAELTLEKIHNVDILLIPVGGVYTIDAKVAAKVISSLEPGIVVPMHYQTEDLTGLSEKLDGIEKFLDEMGVEDNIKHVDKLKVTSSSDIPEETEVVLINPSH